MKSHIILTIQGIDESEVSFMKYMVNATEPMFYPLGCYNTLEEAKVKAEKSIKSNSVIEILVYNDESELIDILKTKRAK